jgi:hypothetical protein
MVAQKRTKKQKEEARTRREKQQEEMAAFLYERDVCANCRKEIDHRRVLKAKRGKWLPLCEKCDIFLKEQLEKCAPLMKEVFGGKKK